MEGYPCKRSRADEQHPEFWEEESVCCCVILGKLKEYWKLLLLSNSTKSCNKFLGNWTKDPRNFARMLLSVFLLQKRHERSCRFGVNHAVRSVPTWHPENLSTSSFILHPLASKCLLIILRSTLFHSLYRTVFKWLSKTKTKVITPTIHNRSEQRDKPIRIPSNHM